MLLEQEKKLSWSWLKVLWLQKKVLGRIHLKKDTTLGNKASTNIPEDNSPDVVGSGGARRDRLLEIEINKSSKIRKLNQTVEKVKLEER